VGNFSERLHKKRGNDLHKECSSDPQPFAQGDPARSGVGYGKREFFELSTATTTDSDLPKARGRQRAARVLLLTFCVACGNPAKERHHKDGDVRNSADGNLTGLCLDCHDAAHGTQKASVAWRS
jgi:hypothetical protein